MPMVPSVAMNGSMRPTVVIRPLARPQAAPIANASTMAATSSRRRICNDAAVHEQDHEAGDEGHHRADGKIEPAGGNDEGGADGDNGDEGAARQNVQQVVDADEIRIGKGAENQKQDERDEGRDGPEIDVCPRSRL